MGEGLKRAARHANATRNVNAGYGWCPKCGATGTTRERRPNGDDICADGHKYPSRTAINQSGAAALLRQNWKERTPRT